MRWTAMDSASGGGGGGGGRDNRFGMGYASNMSLLDHPSDMYNNNGGGGQQQQRPSTSRTPPMMAGCGPVAGGPPVHQRGVKRMLGPGANMCYDPADHHRLVDDGFSPPSVKDVSSPSNGKKTKGRVKIKMEYIENKLRRYTTFSKRKTGIMKKAYELSTLTGTQVMLLVASETGHVYTFATRKLQPMITSEAGKALIQTCLNSPDPCPSASGANTGGDQRMSATGFEETDLSYNIGDEQQHADTKVRQFVYGQQQQSPVHHPHHQQHHPQHIMAMSPPAHLIPSSSPGPLMHTASYQQQCTSPLPLHQQYPHVMQASHSHNQR